MVDANSCDWRSSDRRRSMSLARGLAILAAFNGRPLGINELSELVGMRPSSTHRYVVTLLRLGYLEQQTDRKYRPASRAAEIGHSAVAAMDIRQHARPHLTRVAQETGCTTTLIVLDGRYAVTVARASGTRTHDQMLIGLPGSRTLAHKTPSGRLLLGGSGDDRTSTEPAPNTKPSRRKGPPPIETVYYSAAAVVHTPQGPVAAIEAPSVRESILMLCVDHLLAGADELSASLTPTPENNPDAPDTVEISD